MEQSALGLKLIEIRNARGLTQEEVAERSKVNVRTIQRLESGLVKPRVYTIKALSEALDFDFFARLENGKNADYHSKLKSHAFTWYVKDLFNLKTNTMKKLTILIASAFIIILSSIMISSSFSANVGNDDYPSGLHIVYNNDNTLKEVTLNATNELTLDSLMNIKSRLEAEGITFNYRSLVFDNNYKLVKIIADVNFHDGISGTMVVDSLDSNKHECDRGFRRNYDKNKKVTFLNGVLCEPPFFSK